MSETGVSHAPTRVSGALSIAGAVIAAGLGVGGYGVWGLLAPLGLLGVTGGLWKRNTRILGVGCAALFGAAIVTGLAGGHPARLVVSVAATFLSWDLGEQAMTLGQQLGREAPTWRLEFFHAATGILVAIVGVGSVYGVYTLAGGGQPLLALVFLLVGAGALLAVLQGS